MVNPLYHLLIVKKVIFISLLILSYPSVVAAQESNLAVSNHTIDQSVISRYIQMLSKSYVYFNDRTESKETNKSMDFQNFPVLIKRNNSNISLKDFHFEIFFSRLNRHKKTIQNIKTRTKEKVIKISNIPVNNGYLSSHFGFRKDPMHGSRRLHKGIDIAAKYGSPVNPLGEGLVIYAGYKAGYGNTVEIKHGNSVLTRYAHLKKLLVDEGQQVKIGDRIGLIGSSGRSTGPHLHLEVLLNGNQVDPQIFLVNHFGSRSKPRQITAKKIDRSITKVKVANITEVKTLPKVNKFPQISYQDYVNSVDGKFGLFAPASLSQ